MRSPKIAYLSLELALESTMPTYAGGLGVSAGDALRAAADLGLPVVGVGLVYRQGYFRQSFTHDGVQREEAQPWNPPLLLQDSGARFSIALEGRTVTLRAWRYVIRGVTGHEVPVYLIDSFTPENSPHHRRLTNFLHGGDGRYRLSQEAVLGFGSVALLEALGYDIRLYHMNETHPALAGLALLERERGRHVDAIAAVRRRCALTTETRARSGRDKLGSRLVREVLGESRTRLLARLGCLPRERLDLTRLGLYLSGSINGVAAQPAEISPTALPDLADGSIAGGAHAATWMAPSFRDLFDRRLPGWRRHNAALRRAAEIPGPEIRACHAGCKTALLHEVGRRAKIELSPASLTLGLAGRATVSGRAEQILSNIERLVEIAGRYPLQIIAAGKAHPGDDGGKAMIKRLFGRAERLAGRVPVIYLADLDLELTRLMCAGVDVWLETSRHPGDVSESGGMKAALNGVPSLGDRGGWWLRGHVEGVTGWLIDDGASQKKASSPYQQLESIAGLFYECPASFDAVRRNAIAVNGSFFNAERMVARYNQCVYRPALDSARSPYGNAVNR